MMSISLAEGEGKKERERERANTEREKVGEKALTKLNASTMTSLSEPGNRAMMLMSATAPAYNGTEEVPPHAVITDVRLFK